MTKPEFIEEMIEAALETFSKESHPRGLYFKEGSLYSDNYRQNLPRIEDWEYVMEQALKAAIRKLPTCAIVSSLHEGAKEHSTLQALRTWAEGDDDENDR